MGPVNIKNHQYIRFFKNKIPFNSMKNEVTIIIPCKNEEKNIFLLLNSLKKQTTITKNTPIIIADANSIDSTRKIIQNFKKKNKFNIKIISGGLPGKARNNGAKIAKTEFLLFIDADITIIDKNLIKKVLNLAKSKNLDLVSAKIRDTNKNKKANTLYFLNNLIIRLSKYHKPFCPGAFMLIRNKVFKKLKGFNEKIEFSEDYFLSMQINTKKFGILNNYVYTVDRRFEKTGYSKMVLLFLKTALNHNNKSYFYKKKGYWS